MECIWRRSPIIRYGFSNNTERLRIDSSGNVGIGESNPQHLLHAKTNTATVLSSTLSTRFEANRLRIQNSNTTVGSGAGITLQSQAGSNNYWFMDIVGATSYGSPLVFANRTGSSTVTERMRLDASGNLLVGKPSNDLTVNGVQANASGQLFATTSSATTAVFNRKSSDGVIVSLRQDSTQEGTISVSGTTVSFNGGHLSRWSQTPDNVRIEILKGTVMTNLDQMAVWGDEQNEQLNCMAVSSVEGDSNVAGVFVNWDNDDTEYTNDMNVAMTGDMIIRIAQGTTVQRGDLLMSAGDGTAKPQDDDIVRSKTIAKVTSTNVTCTYADGSYCVPCVLMAC